MDARPREPALSLSRGRPPNVSPARKGWEINVEDDPGAVGAALNLRPPRPVSLGALSSRTLAEGRGICSSADPSWRCFRQSIAELKVSLSGKSDCRFPRKLYREESRFR